MDETFSRARMVMGDEAIERASRSIEIGRAHV